MAKGTWRVLAAGSPDLVWHRPRFSPDGSQVAASLHEGGAWGVAVIDVGSGAVRRLPGVDGTSRYAPAFVASGRELVVVSEQGGIANLELVPIDAGVPRALTRVTGAVVGPDVSRGDSSVWFLALRSGGYDVRRLPSVDGSLGIVAIHGDLTPVVPPTAVTAMLGGSPFTIHDSRFTVADYGLGPRRWRVLPAFTHGADGTTATLMAGNVDPVARLSMVAQGGVGTPGAWSGASVAATSRRLAVAVEASAWSIESRPSETVNSLAPAASDMRYTGTGLVARIAGEGSRLGYVARAGGSAGTVSNESLGSATRIQALAEARGRVTLQLGGLTLGAAAGLSGFTGRTGDDDWRRVITTGALVAGTARAYVSGDFLYGSATRGKSGQIWLAHEAFLAGGSPVPFVDGLHVSQRLAVPGAPPGFAHGARVATYKLSVGGLPFEPFALWAGGGDEITSLTRMAGAERSFSTATLGFVRLPAIRARAGAAWLFDDSFGRRLRAWASVIYSP